VTEELINISKDAFVDNGLDIAEVFGRRDMLTEQILCGGIGYACSAIVQYLNDTGHELAAQALDDAWTARDEQWWREPDGFDGRYLHGQEVSG
jgi:hypothetical protein